MERWLAFGLAHLGGVIAAAVTVLPTVLKDKIEQPHYVVLHILWLGSIYGGLLFGVGAAIWAVWRLVARLSGHPL